MYINILGNQFGSLAVGPLEGVTVDITGVQTWSGITDITGHAKYNGSSPSLRYGDYTVSVLLNGYTPSSQTFNVPYTTSVQLMLIPILTTVEIIVSE